MSSTQLTPRARPAFASLLALFLMASVALACVAVTRTAAADARRTRDAAADAQCRQLLLAGLDRVGAALDRGGEPDLATPAGLSLIAEPAGGRGAFLLTASTGRRAWVAEAAWEPDAAGRWRLASTSIRPRASAVGPPPRP